MNLDIRFFQTARGDEPVRDYIRALPVKERARVEGCLYALGVTGRLDMPHGRKLVGYKDLYDVRSGRHRILYGIHEGEAIMLTAFVKKSQETPKAEIEVALRRFANYASQGG